MVESQTDSLPCLSVRGWHAGQGREGHLSAQRRTILQGSEGKAGSHREEASPETEATGRGSASMIGFYIAFGGIVVACFGIIIYVFISPKR